MSKEKNREKLEKKILEEGKKVNAVITSCKCTDDPEDDEHTIFDIEFKYNINGADVKKSVIFSINTAHIIYAHEGGLLGVPKIKHSLDDYKKSLMPGEIFEIITLDKPPYHHINQFNEISREIMSIPQVWS